MAQSNANKAVVQDATGAVATWFSLHIGDPGTTGANEGSGTGHARGQTTWDPSSGGTKNGSVAPLGAAAQNYTHWGLWTAASGGTFHIGGALPSPESYAAPGQYLLDPTMV